MRQGQQHRRSRGRNNNSSSGGNGQNQQQNQRKGQNPLSRSFESNGPDVKVRGTPAHVAEKYLQLARDAQSSGDPVLAENYLQHAEHYNRIIMTYREQQGLPNTTSETNNGGHPRSRFDGPDTDDQDDESASDDIGQSEQPMVPRFAAEQQRSHEQPRHDNMRHENMREDRPHRTQDTQQNQNQGQHRFRDRNERQERPRHSRQDRFERPDRADPRQDQRPEARPEPRQETRQEPRQEQRAERHERASERQDQRTDRGDRSERSGERGFDRDRGTNGERVTERAPIVDRQTDERLPDARASETRAMEFREPKVLEPRAPRERMIEEQPAPPVVEAAVTAPPRAEAPARVRRERFAPGEQPDFLRRPVRRPRREVEAVVPPLPQADADEPPRD